VKLAELDGERWLDDDDPLTDEQKALLEARLADMDQQPEASLPWDEARKKDRIETRQVTYRLEIRPDALTDIEQAARWYEECASGLGTKFERETLETIDSLPSPSLPHSP
jgi:hypothetical protein